MPGSAVSQQPAANLPAALIQALGASLTTDPAELQFFAQDVFAEGKPLLGVVRPDTVDDAQRMVAAALVHRIPVIPRGGGLSYTDGYLAQQPALLFDLTGLNRILDINVADRYVVVEAGVRWADLDAALAPHGLRTPYWGPLSGLKATVGGALSQGSVFLGSGLHGSVGDSVLGVEVITGRGDVLVTGSAAAGNTPAFLRYFGPDLTGLFIGDCGALGFKVRATLRLIERPKALEFLSYEFSDAPALLRALAELSRAGLASECFGFDPTLANIRMKRASLFADAKALANVVKQSGLIAGAKLVAAGRDFLDAEKFSGHAIVEADSPAALKPRANAAIRIFAKEGKATENSIPKAMRATPFVPPNNMLGPAGERWVPVHGIVPHSKAEAAYHAVEAVFAKHRALIDQHRIQVGYLMTTIAQQGTLVEPVFFWPDAHLAYHKRMVERVYLAKIGEPAPNPAAYAAVVQLKREVADTLRALGATHFQLGRFYDYRKGRDPAALALFDAVKAALDPHQLINPGVLR